MGTRSRPSHLEGSVAAFRRPSGGLRHDSNSQQARIHCQPEGESSGNHGLRQTVDPKVASDFLSHYFSHGRRPHWVIPPPHCSRTWLERCITRSACAVALGRTSGNWEVASAAYEVWSANRAAYTVFSMRKVRDAVQFFKYFKTPSPNGSLTLQVLVVHATSGLDDNCSFSSQCWRWSRALCLVYHGSVCCVLVVCCCTSHHVPSDSSAAAPAVDPVGTIARRAEGVGWSSKRARVLEVRRARQNMELPSNRVGNVTPPVRSIPLLKERVGAAEAAVINDAPGLMVVADPPWESELKERGSGVGDTDEALIAAAAKADLVEPSVGRASMKE